MANSTKANLRLDNNFVATTVPYCAKARLRSSSPMLHVWQPSKENKQTFNENKTILYVVFLLTLHVLGEFRVNRSNTNSL